MEQISNGIKLNNNVSGLVYDIKIKCHGNNSVRENTRANKHAHYTSHIVHLKSVGSTLHREAVLELCVVLANAKYRVFHHHYKIIN